MVVALSFIDEWDRSTKAVNSHFTATDGAGGMAQRGFWARRQYLFPRAYLEYKGKAGEGAPLPPEEKDGTSPAAVQTPAADLAAEGMEEALLPGGRSPDGRYEVRVRGSVEAPYGYEILVYAAGGKQPIHTLADVGGILRYSTAREECKALWHPSSKFVVFTDQPTKHSRVLHILAVSGDRVERLKAPDYAMNAIGRADAVENYRRSVPTPQRWEGDDLHLNFRFDTRDGEFSSEVVLHLRHGGNAAPVIELKSVSPAKPADP